MSRIEQSYPRKMDLKVKQTEKGILLGILFIAFGILIGNIASSFDINQGSSLVKSPREILGAVYIYYLGLLFLLSYFYEHKSFLFRWLMWICLHFSHPVGYGRNMAFIYFGLSFAVGTIVLLAGLGVISV